MKCGRSVERLNDWKERKKCLSLLPTHLCQLFHKCNPTQPAWPATCNLEHNIDLSNICKIFQNKRHKEGVCEKYEIIEMQPGWTCCPATCILETKQLYLQWWPWFFKTLQSCLQEKILRGVRRVSNNVTQLNLPATYNLEHEHLYK